MPSCFLFINSHIFKNINTSKVATAAICNDSGQIHQPVNIKPKAKTNPRSETQKPIPAMSPTIPEDRYLIIASRTPQRANRISPASSSKWKGSTERGRVYSRLREHFNMVIINLPGREPSGHAYALRRVSCARLCVRFNQCHSYALINSPCFSQVRITSELR
jgi:hypothetical protein